MKIEFKISTVYEDLLTSMSRKTLYQKDISELFNFKNEFQKEWRKKERKIIESIEKNSKLKFKKEKLTCYLVNRMLYKAISDPLTLKIGIDLIDMQITLTHELIHVLFEQNAKKIKSPIFEKYPEEEKSFQIHVPLLMILERVIQDIYGKEITEKFKKKDLKNFKLEWLEVKEIRSKYKGNLISFLKK